MAPDAPARAPEMQDTPPCQPSVRPRCLFVALYKQSKNSASYNYFKCFGLIAIWGAIPE